MLQVFSLKIYLTDEQLRWDTKEKRCQLQKNWGESNPYKKLGLRGSPQPPATTSIILSWISSHLYMLSLYRHCEGSVLKLEKKLLPLAGIQLQLLPGSSALVRPALHCLKLGQHLKSTCGLKQSLVIVGLVFVNKIHLKKYRMSQACRLLEAFWAQGSSSATGQQI